MAVYVKRVQTLLTEEEYQELIRLAAESKKPLSVLIRESIQVVYLEQALRERRHAAVTSLLELEAPVADWEQIEQEIVCGALEP